VSIEVPKPARSKRILGVLLLRSVPFWQRSRSRRIGRLIVLVAAIYITSMLVFLSLEDRFLYPGATFSRSWSEPPEYLRVRDLTFDSSSGDRIHA
jgi:hypothetical protein